jgi:hypothetical protein
MNKTTQSIYVSTIAAIIIFFTTYNQTIAQSPTETPDQPSENTQEASTNIKTQADLSIVTGNIQRPNGLTWHDDKLYTVCSGDWTLYEVDTVSGATSQYLYGVRNAHTLFADTSGESLELWIPDFQSNNLVHVHNGVSDVIATNLSGPWGITDLDDNTFAISNLSSNTIASITRDGVIQETISQLRSPTGLAADSDYIYVANSGSTRRAIEWYKKSDLKDIQEPIDSGEIATEQLLVSGLQNTTSLTLGSDNLLYFSYSLGTRGVVGRIDPEVCRANGGCTSEMVEIVLYTELASPLAGLTLTPDMKLFIHSIFSPDIYWVQLDSPTETPE